MVRELNIPDNLTASPVEPDNVVLSAAKGYRRRRETNPTLQMSIRMREDVYDRYRALCEEERRTNGDMLETLMTFYLKNREKPGR